MFKKTIRNLRAIWNLILTPSNYRADYWHSLVKSNRENTPPLPWMNYKVIQYLENQIRDPAHVFEYGSGSSTEYWLNNGCIVTSIEHNRDFYLEMIKKLGNRCQYLLIEPQPMQRSDDESVDSPDSFKSSDFHGFSFEEYVKSIDEFENETFDMVIVDGRARPSCIKRALPKIKRQGILVLDNSDRGHYLSKTHILLNEWPRKTFKGTVRGLLHHEETSVFHKP